jgi:hypothetical protein
MSLDVLMSIQGVYAWDMRCPLYRLPRQNDRAPGIYTKSSVVWAAMAQGRGIPKFGTRYIQISILPQKKRLIQGLSLDLP